MKIFSPDAPYAQVFYSYAVRYAASVNINLDITNESTKEVTTLVSGVDLIVTPFTDNVFYLFSFLFQSNEGDSFSLKLYDSDTQQVLWRDKAFSTSQTTQKYKINV